MKQKTICSFLAFLEFLAKTEIGPVAGLPHNFVTFTLSELRSALREMDENDELYLRFKQETETQKANVENIAVQYPELKAYTEVAVDLVREPDEIPSDELGRYEVIFEVEECRYYCFIDAINMNEALGQFFRSHPNLTYNNIIEHIEV